MSNETKWTTGEWECDYRDDECAYLKGPPRSYSECYFENAYDAYVMAASKNLYVELEDARAAIDALIAEGYTGYVDQRGRIDRALAKARGDNGGINQRRST